jgi:hypothetical protein
MNPVDHPMGGGEGRASGGHPRSRNGMPAKGYKTRRRRNIRISILLKEEKQKNNRYEPFAKKRTIYRFQAGEASFGDERSGKKSSDQNMVEKICDLS